MDSENGIRINKYLSEAGFCSRREADRLVAEGRVLIGGELAVNGSKVLSGNVVLVDGQPVECGNTKVVYALNKPQGYISSLSDEQGEGISRFIPEGMRLFPVGRLDKDSDGLMLLTNDGALMNSILAASGGHEKEYLVRVDHDVTESFVHSMEVGVVITNGTTGERVKTAPCKIIKVDKRSFKIILIQGLNRQIRRMCGELSYKVERLTRIRIMNVKLGDLAQGQIRELMDDEKMELYRGQMNG